MNKRQAKKIAKAVAQGRPFKTWKTPALCEAFEIVYGSRFGWAVLTFARAAVAIRRFSEEANHALAA